MCSGALGWEQKRWAITETVMPTPYLFLLLPLLNESAKARGRQFEIGMLTVVCNLTQEAEGYPMSTQQVIFAHQVADQVADQAALLKYSPPPSASS